MSAGTPTGTAPADGPGAAGEKEPEEVLEPLLLLASSSLGRRRTLESAGIAFTAQAADLDEDALLDSARQEEGSLAPEEAVLLLARAKAEAVTAQSEGGYVVLGCDSMLELPTDRAATGAVGAAADPLAAGDGAVREIVGKPHTPERATERWRQLRGRTAVLHSGHWIVDDRDPEDGGTGATLGATASTEVTFADVSDEEIAAYVATGEPLQVAGAFTIDGLGGPFVTRVDGDPHAVVGLSLPLLRELLAEIDLPIHVLWAGMLGH